MSIDVKGSMKATTSFIEGQGVDADAAYQRLKITRRFLKEYREAVNSTNTSDVVGNLARLYDNLETTAKVIIKEEQLLISLGE